MIPIVRVRITQTFQLIRQPTAFTAIEEVLGDRCIHLPILTDHVELRGNLGVDGQPFVGDPAQLTTETMPVRTHTITPNPALTGDTVQIDIQGEPGGVASRNSSSL